MVILDDGDELSFKWYSGKASGSYIYCSIHPIGFPTNEHFILKVDPFFVLDFDRFRFLILEDWRIDEFMNDGDDYIVLLLGVDDDDNDDDDDDDNDDDEEEEEEEDEDDDDRSLFGRHPYSW